MRSEKIKELKELLQGDPRNKQMLIYLWPKDDQGLYDVYECILHFKDIPSKVVTVEEGNKISDLYPDVPVIKVVYESEKPKRQD